MALQERAAGKTRTGDGLCVKGHLRWLEILYEMGVMV